MFDFFYGFSGIVVLVLGVYFFWRHRAPAAQQITVSTIIDTMPAYLFVMNTEGQIIITNSATTNALGLPRDAVLGKSIAVFFPDAHHLWAAAQSLPLEQTILLRNRDSFLRSSGRREISVSISASVIRDAHQLFAGFIIVCIDMQRTKELTDLRNRFIQIVSHQLQTPIGVVRWNLETLLSSGSGALRHTQSELVSISHKAVIEVIRRISDLLTILDIEEGHIAINRSPTSLVALWESVIVELGSHCAAKQITYVYHPPATPPPLLFIDSEKIRLVLYQLADNAISYTAPHGEIRVGFSDAGRAVRFTITDTGVGISRDEQSRVFSRFFRSSSALTAKPDASGIGLSIAKYFIEQHGGTMGFSSTPGQGSTFWFELPVA